MSITPETTQIAMETVHNLRTLLLSMGLQPIETAPKDGTHIIVVTLPEEPGQNSCTCVHWFNGEWALSVNYDGEHSNHGVSNPTHWKRRPQDEESVLNILKQAFSIFENFFLKSAQSLEAQPET